MKITFSVVAGPNRGEQFSFDAHDTFIVGRGSTAHLRLPAKDRFFSRHHFLVELNPPLCRLMDMASTNGTYVNGTRISDVIDLQDGDVIRGGDTEIRVAMEEPGLRVTHRESSGPLERQTQREPRPLDAPRKTFVEGPRRPPDATLQLGLPHGDNQAARRTCRESPRASALGQVGEYQLIGELGRGGMGVVYLVTKHGDGRRLALKRFGPPRRRHRAKWSIFCERRRMLRRLDHPHIVRFDDLGQADGQLYFAMEYVPGEDLHRILKQEGPLSIPRAIGLVRQLLAGLEHAHERRIVHRDIKPANALVSNQQGREIAKLADFGLARVYQTSRISGLTMQGQMGGSPAYLPPEQITNFRESMPASDQYAIGATLYEMLTGMTVYDFKENLNQRLIQILQDPPVSILERRSDLPRPLAAIVDRTLRRNTAERFPNVTAFRQALAPFATT